mmetsp:Transcript_9556/g.12983  ORF Transcript_9556/g.12983 Transcript_9556/m.12983 type:complete len:104 (+) Transcript_9556:149-460(+)|eukprot:CAMPEP_0196589942 /NCGR_PEP_ID=MMETSP1081-20130531/65058_1 /TAXON_ID=36882 /ORGANISM="Pyramimonas amylifera, Strain CCMP720" /LENGTH=103 /DNA_ID=CAMNT_0041912885 /DNA_START=143 /DNA_END=454 /DNA_ORIENTATION=+
MSGEASADTCDVKPEVKPILDTINLKVKDQDGHEVQFKVKPSTKFEKIFSAFCERRSIAKDGIRFLFDGVRLNGTQTPGEMNMEDNDIIDALVTQLGGGVQCI